MIFIYIYCCCHGNTMARKCTEKCRAVGFYKELTGEKEIVEDAPESLIISGKESDVYEVERLVDKRIKKVSPLKPVITAMVYQSMVCI